MDPYYLGYVEFIHEDLWGRIRPLAVVKRRSIDDAWVIDRKCQPNELGNTGLVFWPKIPHCQDPRAHQFVADGYSPWQSDPDSRAQDQLTHHYVRFKVERNRRTSDPERDEFVVAEERRNGNRHPVWPIGLPIIPEDRVEGPDRVLVSDVGLRPDATVYRRRLKGTLIDGPWRVVALDNLPRLCLRPKEDDYVAQHVLGRLDAGTFHVWDDDKGESQAILLVEPAKAAGRVIDLLPDSGLAGWLIRLLKRDKGFLTSLDRASPGWRGRIGELLGTATDQNRSARLGAALDALAADEARLSDLVELPRFKAVLDAAIGREVASLRERIEATAVEETHDFVVQQTLEREREKARTEYQKQTLLRELDEVRAEVADTKRLRAQAQVQVERDESAIRAAADYLVESRERIIRDFAAFHGLIENARANGDGSANGHLPAVASDPKVPAPDGPAIDDPAVFLKRLAPKMAVWGARATSMQAKRLHAALLSCRWVAVPCPSWGVAYAEAMGAHARHRVVAVEPTWLAFSDAWDGEMGAFWNEAVERRDTLHLLIFADADRALAQCWARPLLDIVSGLRSVLPSGLPWPENLRMIACPSADEAALPVPDWVVAHWAGVTASGGTPSNVPIVRGHVPFATWAGWVTTPDEAARPSIGLGVAARAAARERSALARTFQRLDPDGDPEDAERIAREVREFDARTVFAREARG